MAKRRRSRRNPKPLTWAIIGVSAIAVGGLSYWGYRAYEDRRRKKDMSELPPPPQNGKPDRPIPPIITEPPDRGLGVGPCGADYPGFVRDKDGCEPGPTTPAGFYVGEGCSDFVFVEGEEGPQIQYLSALIDVAVAESSDAAAKSADPTELATDFFMEFWEECRWPPVPMPGDPSSTARMANLYMGLVYVIGRTIIAEGGRVLGTSDPDFVDEQIAERLAELGFGDFDPTVVPEIRLPDPDPGPGVGKGGGAQPGQLSFAP